ncbi:hypothetical protein GH714_015219 [Hevea brasiliensis]|uniref:Exocyst complex component Sec8 n=1 Tax=Hevea brasiliensis TaxID=3981 RepID=A0A6A6LCT5_HEVBR|nr:hypothetical protein GH714_015219 [Hevea brasiliensis]
MAPLVAGVKRNYIFGGICSIAANASIKACLAFITEHEQLFTGTEYANLLKVQVPGREIPPDAQDRISDILSR